MAPPGYPLPPFLLVAFPLGAVGLVAGAVEEVGGLRLNALAVHHPQQGKNGPQSDHSGPQHPDIGVEADDHHPHPCQGIEDGGQVAEIAIPGHGVKLLGVPGAHLQPGPELPVTAAVGMAIALCRTPQIGSDILRRDPGGHVQVAVEDVVGDMGQDRQSKKEDEKGSNRHRNHRPPLWRETGTGASCRGT